MVKTNDRIVQINGYETPQGTRFHSLGSIIHQDGGTEKMWFIESNQDGESGDVPLEVCVITRYL